MSSEHFDEEDFIREAERLEFRETVDSDLEDTDDSVEEIIDPIVYKSSHGFDVPKNQEEEDLLLEECKRIWKQWANCGTAAKNKFNEIFCMGRNISVFKYKQIILSCFPNRNFLDNLSRAVEKEWEMWKSLHAKFVLSGILEESSVAAKLTELAIKFRKQYFELLQTLLRMYNDENQSFHRHSVWLKYFSHKNKYKEIKESESAFNAVIGEILFSAKDVASAEELRMLSEQSSDPIVFLECLAKQTEAEEEQPIIDESSVLTVSDDNKRTLSKEMLENKGLPARSKRVSKKFRNPRVNMRRRHRKKLVQKRSQIKDHKYELTPYQGESHGIRLGLIKSRKF